VRGQGLKSTIWKGCLVIVPATRETGAVDWKSNVLDYAEGGAADERGGDLQAFKPSVD